VKKERYTSNKNDFEKCNIKTRLLIGETAGKKNSIGE